MIEIFSSNKMRGVLVCLCLLFASSVFAQPRKYTYTPIQKKPTFDTLYTTDIGFNCTELIKNALFFNTQNVVSFYPFDFSFRHLKKNRRDFYRAGFSFSLAGSNFQGINSFQFPVTRNNTFTFRSGTERHRLLAKNLILINGSDFRTGFKNFRNIDAGTGTFESLFSFFIGGAQVIGLEYRVAERFRFSTEAAFMANLQFSDQPFTGLLQFPVFGNSVISGLEVHLMIPTFINASYAF